MKKRLRKITLISLPIILFIVFWFSLAFPLFNNNYSTVVYSNEGELLGAYVAPDHQWRFPYSDYLPQRYVKALIAYEDEHFYKHIGVNPLSILRAAKQNIAAGRVVSGGSTITMQLIRLSKGRERTFVNKIIEAVQALRLEIGTTKDEILSLYAAHAPFGGNVVGIEAAAWRYFNRPSSQLSWAESAMLAVLPNAPGLIHTGKNRDRLLEKRNILLKKLHETKEIDDIEYSLAISEPIPPHPYPLEQIAPHLLGKYIKEGGGKSYRTTIDISLQRDVNNIVANHHNRLKGSAVYNAAAIVVDVLSGRVLAYCGNTTPTDNEMHENHVDIIQSKRSTGSVLKPILHSAALQEGVILPTQLLADIPTYYKNFAPKNYNHSFDGAVAADKALSRSLNVPAVRLLNEYDVTRFCSILQKVGIHSIDKSPDHYGLSLILGGAEATLYEFVGCYASMMRTLHTYTTERGRYYRDEFQAPLILDSDTLSRGELSHHYPALSAGAIYSTFEAMTGVARPEEEDGWQNFVSGDKIAWKTGTSFGYRDAWSIGVTSRYVVGVWAGNATGEGRPEIVGGRAAAPIMFDIFRRLPREEWIEPPYGDMMQMEVCRHSGCVAGEFCPRDTIYTPITNKVSRVCPYHQLVHLSKDMEQLVDADCYPIHDMVHKSWFTLPPAMELYYSKVNPYYQKLPPYHPQATINKREVMEFIYPQNSNKVFLPKDIDKSVQPVVLRVAHNNPNAKIYWHVDDRYIGETIHHHDMELNLKAGSYSLTLSDEDGNMIKRDIEFK